MTEDLTRANEIISRYVASQLAAQVRAGDYNSLSRHERRKLTLFFSDIVGFSSIADRIEPEDLSMILCEYLSEMTSIGERYGATIDKFVGDAIMIYFGAPVATDDRDHALRAVRMAVEMQQRLVAFRAEWSAKGFEQTFHVRIGINTGHASVGSFGSSTRMDYTAIGRQVNLAARIQAECRPDGILLSQSSWLLVRDDVSCSPLGEISVKGVREPTKVYEVVSTGHP
jgi:class 3 adenylate cyclase